jgi:ribosomal protein S18 acetylase RimI-like enzyme
MFYPKESVMSLAIRNAQVKDFDDIYPLFGQLWPNKPIDKAELKKAYDRGADSNNDEFLCAVIDGKIAGFCAYAIVNNLWQEGRIGYIYAMVVDEALRGKGVGTKLINESLERAKAQGLKRMELDSGFPRERAHKFYEKLGFEKRAYLFSYVL